MRILLLLILLLGQSALLEALSSSNVERLEPVLRPQMTFKEEPALLRKRRQENHQPFPSSLSLEFEAFGTPFHFELDVHRQLTEGSKLTLYNDGVIVEERPFEHLVYRGEKLNERGELIGWINLVAHHDGLFNALFLVDGEMYAVDPLEIHENDLDAVTKRDLEAMSDLVIYKTSEMKLGDKKCGTVSRKRARSNDTEADFQQTSTTYHPLGRIGRNLQTVARWTNCFPTDTTTRSFSIAFYVDYGYYKFTGATPDKIQANLLNIISNANIIYYTQVNIYLKVGTTYIQTAANGDSFNQDTSCTTIDATLTGFKNWRASSPRTSNNEDGTYHLLTRCYPSGTVGLAYVGVLCDKNSGAGVSGNAGGGMWLTVAHEVGHNFGANHAFQEGQGTTGGIMDYGDGKLNGEYQFHTTYNKAEVCNEITSSMSMTGSSKVTNCWKTFSAVCGNGIVEPGEDCDDTSSCCSGCKFIAGAVCSGTCCDSSTCQYSPTTVTCGDQSYCANGVCTPTACSQFSNLAFCPFSASNPCLTNCLYNGNCVASTSFSTFTNRNVADGVVCKTSPYSTCQNGACVAATYAWYTGAWSTCSLVCGDETKTRTVQCKKSDGTVLADSSCTGTKPATSQSCGNPTCASSTFTWAKTSSSCSAGTNCNVAGTITNTITCKVNGTTTVANSYCTSYATNAQPAATESCLGTCSGTWSTGSWSTCTLPCGDETKTRTVACRNSGGTAIADSNCNGTKPDASASCGNVACSSLTFTWVKAAGTCSSSTCNVAGTITNTITCRVSGTTTVADSYCTSYATNAKPAATEACTGACIPTWFTGPWSTCTLPCGDETRTRAVECRNPDSSAAADSSCTGTKPDTSASCGNPSCSSLSFTWVKVAGTCSSSTCNVAGTITNTVTCKMGGTTTVADSYCTTYATSAKPAATETCLGSCSTSWSAGPWSTCTLPCGDETRTRTVQCRQSDGTVVADGLCLSAKPDPSASCDNPSCSSLTFTWVKVSGPCSSSTCNVTGTITNTVTCQLQGGKAVPESYCASYATSSKPALNESCVGQCGPSHTYSWVITADAWGPCSAKSCKQKGVQYLLSVCKDEGGQQVSEGLCSSPMPQETSRPCQGACSSKQSGTNIGIAVGAGAGGLLVIGLICALVYFMVIKKRLEVRNGLATESKASLNPSIYELETSSHTLYRPPPPPLPAGKPNPSYY